MTDPKEHECDPDICTCHEDEDQDRFDPNDNPGHFERDYEIRIAIEK